MDTHADAPDSPDTPDTPDAATLVSTYFDRAVDPDREAYIALFADDVVVEDEGREHHGLDAVRRWRGEVPDVTYEVRELVAAGGAWEAVTTVAGSFPGSPVDLRHRFRFDPDGQVTELRIRP